MKLIQPNCRIQFTAEDVDFVVAILGQKIGAAECITQLLGDVETRDLILEDESLYRALLERRDCLRVSAHFYFYILVRQVLRRAGLLDRSVADYVAEVLAEFSAADRARGVLPGSDHSMDYFFEMVAALQNADSRTSFGIRAHMGNYSLFITGLFPDRVRQRAQRRGAPGLSYYERMGQEGFKQASAHTLAERYQLARIYGTLAEQFRTTREALNDMSDRLFSWEEVGGLELFGRS